MRFATRGSRLARHQAERVGAALGGDHELVVVSTEGDRRLDVDLHSLGGRGVFAKEVQQAVLDGRADAAVHSAKDLPSAPVPGLVIAAVTERADPRDVLVGSAWADLATGARVGTSAVRRRAQLAHARPDLRFGLLRGNIETRLERAAAFDAVVVAAAALDRLELAPQPAEHLDPSIVLPQVGQGAIAVECRDDDAETRARLVAVEDRSARRAVDAERAFLAHLGGGCDVPCGALARPDLDDPRGAALVLDVALASLDGHVVLRLRRTGAEPEVLGRDAAEALLDGAGGRHLLGDAA